MTDSTLPHSNDRTQADLTKYMLLDMRAVAKMTFQTSSIWIEEWVDYGYGPKSVFPDGRGGFPFTTLYDVINWWASDNFVAFQRYVEERSTSKRKWSNSKWFYENRDALVRIDGYKFGYML